MERIETDVDTFLAGEADRLRVIATAMRGLAGDMGGASIEPKVLHASAAELEAVARGGARRGSRAALPAMQGAGSGGGLEDLFRLLKI